LVSDRCVFKRAEPLLCGGTHQHRLGVPQSDLSDEGLMRFRHFQVWAPGGDLAQPRQVAGAGDDYTQLGA
ncbi:hypothetical protein, partial [Variovorax sp. WDL1]|uniref:hypothetical protein n=1 Tax=Variovorax sp. WDL1 TaxID=207745 RepID=UPI001E55372A